MSTGIKWGEVLPENNANKIIILGSGKSLKGFDLERINRKDYYVITVNNSIIGAPFANAWFTLDPWGLDGKQLPKRPFQGKMYAGVPDDFGRSDARNKHYQKKPNPKVIFLHRLISHNYSYQSSETAYTLGLSEDKRCVATGNSGYGAFNIAYHLRPKKILLLGLDGGMGYFYSETESNRPLTFLPKMFDSTYDQIQKANIEVINGSEHSTIKTYPRYSIEKALELFDAD